MFPGLKFSKMAACSKHVPRFKKALEFRGLQFPADIINVIGKRATSDRELDSILNAVCQLLEPPSCQKTHCPQHTVYGFAGCNLNLVPGRCKLNTDYLKRRKERQEKLLNERLMQLPEELRDKQNDESKARILAMSNEDFEKAILKLNVVA